MVKANKVLKLLFISFSLILLILLVSSPKTDCQACSLEYDGEIYDGYEAFEFYEDACISYAKPWGIQPMPNFTNVTIMDGYLT